MGCFPPIGGYTKSGAMLVVMAKKMPHHGAAILGGTSSLCRDAENASPGGTANDPLVGGRTVQGILLPMCTPLMATLVKGHLP